MKKLHILILTAMILVSFTACKSGDYKDAMELYTHKEYEAALSIFTELGDYKDSANMANKCKYAQAQLLMDAGKYENARMIFEELGDYEDSVENVKECSYRQAIALMESKKYDSAEQLFTMLGDYKDSANYAESMGWYAFLNYVSEQGELSPENLMYNHVGSITADSNCLYVEIENSIFSAKVILSQGSAVADLYATFHTKIGYAESTERGYTKWNIRKYSVGDTVKWDEYEYTDNGRLYDGTYAKKDRVEILPGDSGANLMTALTDCIQKGLEESGLDVTMADLGFANYKA